MNEDWEKRWNENRIGFHKNKINEYLEKYIEHLGQEGDDVFVPLCGKSLDMIYLSKHFKKVIGVELAQKAITSFISENNLPFTYIQLDKLDIYSMNNIDFYLGDIFDYDYDGANKINIFDRASLVAFDKETRIKYSQKIIKILSGNMLLITLEYPQNEKKGPPFSVPEKEVYELYGKDCDIKLLETINLNDTNDKLASLSSSCEKVFLISPKK